MADLIGLVVDEQGGIFLFNVNGLGAMVIVLFASFSLQVGAKPLWLVRFGKFCNERGQWCPESFIHSKVCWRNCLGPVWKLPVDSRFMLINRGARYKNEASEWFENIFAVRFVIPSLKKCPDTKH